MSRSRSVCSLLWVFSFAAACGHAAGPETFNDIGQSGWGVDACLTVHVGAEEAERFIENLQTEPLRWVRERSLPAVDNQRVPRAQQLAVLERARDAGLLPVLFSTLPRTLPKQPGNVLPEDLLEVFRAGQELAAINGGRAVAFELLNEADVGYCKDLPDRVVAYQKALYLGLKAVEQGADGGPQRAEGGGQMADGRRRTAEGGGHTAEGGAANQRGEGAASPLFGPPPSGSTPPSESAPPSAIRRLPSDSAPSDSAPPSAVSPLPSGAASPLVLLGALALPPGPWLERATRNGLLDYADAYNYHFYGLAEDFTGVYQAHRAFLDENATPGMAAKRDTKRKAENESYATGAPRPHDPERPGHEGRPYLRNPRISASRWAGDWRLNEDFAFAQVSSSRRALREQIMPLWVTEVGINAVDPDDFLNAERRQLQADFTVSTARQALKAKDLAVFMPFILAHKGDPHALTLGPDQPLPAWEAYTRFIREHPWPARPVARVPADPNPLVVQWLADNTTTVPHKVSGTYRFWQDRPIRGELRLYNFSDHPIRGRLELPQLEHVELALDARPETGNLTERGSAKRVTPNGVALKRSERVSAAGALRAAAGTNAEFPNQRPDGGRQRAEDRKQPADGGAANQRGEGAASPLFGPPPSGSTPPSESAPPSAVSRQPSDSAPSGSDTQVSGLKSRPSTLVVPPMGMVSVPVVFRTTTPGYFREFWEAVFVDEAGRRSPVYFGLERWPEAKDFTESPLALSPLGQRGIAYPSFPDYRPGETVGVWTTMNGLRVSDGGAANQRGEGAASPLFGPPPSESAPPSAVSPPSSGSSPPSAVRRLPSGSPPRFRFWTDAVENDPLQPTMAVAKIDSLPPDGFVRVQLSRRMDKDVRVRLDLVDKHGQRFTIWENFGVSYAVPSTDVWLNLADFHIHFWGRCTERPQFRPEDMREVQLRIYLAKPNDAIEVGLSVMRAK